MTVNPRILNFVNFKIFGTYVTKKANPNFMVTTLPSAKLVKQSLIVKSWERMKSRDTDFTVIMIVISKFILCRSVRRSNQQKAIYSFVMNYVRNLHNRCHNRSCWKKGLWCRFLLPKMPSHEETCVRFLDDMRNMHISWDGIQTLRRLFQVVPKRAFSDAYVNSHHSWTSIVLACNTNIQVGLDGKHIMYCTLYTGNPLNRKIQNDMLKL